MSKSENIKNELLNCLYKCEDDLFMTFNSSEFNISRVLDEINKELKVTLVKRMRTRMEPVMFVTPTMTMTE